MSSRFEVSEVPADENATSENGRSESSSQLIVPSSKLAVCYMIDLLLGVKAEEAAGEDTAQPQVDYLTANRNINTNQLTVSSVTSGNLALYEVCPSIAHNVGS